MSKVQEKLTARTRSPMTKDDPFYDEISQVISEHGWVIIGLGSENPLSFIPFIHTIGNYECGLPELLMIGPSDTEVLAAITVRMRNNDRAFADGETIDIGERYKPKAFWANDEAREYTPEVGKYYGSNDYTVQQIVIPDKLGRYPGDRQCDLPFRWVPLLRSDERL
jgi:hypothetical protein